MLPLISSSVSRTGFPSLRTCLAAAVASIFVATAQDLIAQEATLDAGTEWSRDDFLAAIADLRSPEGDRTALRTAVLRRIDPFHEDIDLLENDLLGDILGHGVAVAGCAAGGPVVGFYSPLLHVWLSVELDTSGSAAGLGAQVSGVSLGQGFPSGPGRMLWWPDLVSEGLAIAEAIQVVTATQVDAFQAWFSEEDCPEFSGGAFSPNAALAQIGEIDAEWPYFSHNLKPQFVANFGERTGTDLRGWEVFERLPGTDPDWVLIFTSADFPGAAIIGHWESRDAGNVYYSGHEVVSFLPGASPLEAEVEE